MRPLWTWIADVLRGRRRNKEQRVESLQHIRDRIDRASEDNLSASQEVKEAIIRRVEASAPLRDVLDQVIARQQSDHFSKPDRGQ